MPDRLIDTNILVYAYDSSEAAKHEASRDVLKQIWEAAGGDAFEVEFSDREGRTYESLGLRPAQIMVLHYEPMAGHSMSETVPA